MAEKITKEVFLTKDGVEFEDENDAKMHEEYIAWQYDINRFLERYESVRSKAMASNIINKFARFKIGFEDQDEMGDSEK